MWRLEVGLLLVTLVLASGCRKKEDARPVGTGKGTLAVASGHACLLRGDRTIWCWGSNRLGGVGVRSPHPSQQYQPSAVRVNVPPAKQIAIASVETCFEAEAGGFSCWGGNLSDSDASPRRVELPPSGRLVGGPVGCLLDASGTATCWGENTNARIAPGDSASVSGTFGTKLPPLSLRIGVPIDGIAVGDRHTCVLAKDGKVLCWGLNNFGQLAVDDVQHRAEPKPVEGLPVATQVVSGAFHSCALDAEGGVHCWGRADEGQLGIGEVKPAHAFSDSKYTPKPTRVKGLEPVRSIASGSSTTCAVTRGGKVYCWGGNDQGQVGDGTATNRHTPVLVEPLGDVAEVQLGYDHACARLASDEVWCWGDGDDGKLGSGSIEDSAVPVQVKLGTERTGPDPTKVDLVEYESLACGFRLKLPGKREYQELDDNVVEYLGVPSKPPSRFGASCVLLRKMATKTPEELEKLLIEEKPPPKLSRRSVDGVQCVEVVPPEPKLHGHRLTCFTQTHYVSISAFSEDAKRSKEVLDSVSFFDPKALSARPEGAPPPAPQGMVAVPEGEVVMGCANQSLFDKPTGELGCIERAQPLHRVHLPAFFIDRTEVSVGDYAACVAAGKCKKVEGPEVPVTDREPDKPMSFVDWTEAQAYCEWKGKRLPTEAEWERAARGTDGRSRPWGDTRATCEQASLLSCNGPAAVGTHAAGKSPYGAEDMVGNVKEWVADRFGLHYFLESPRENPQGPEQGAQRTIKGSSYMTAAGSEAVYWRQGNAPGHRDKELGFRCAQTAGGEARKRSSCGCVVPGGRDTSRHAWALVLLGLAAAVGRRRHRAQPGRGDLQGDFRSRDRARIRVQS